ncbi:MAG: T9SS type A sorting domain-containing protein [Sphingomonadales bacterium]|nr:T9SS type A sorting domain-containing protein [Sphingomonadales bacterium]
MKYILRILSALFALTAGNISAQAILNDSAIMGPGYANQIFYDIKTGAKNSASVNNWDIAHTSVSRDNSIRANHMSGLRVIQYPKGKTDAWSTFDTAGWKTWSFLWNDIHDHNKGAFNLYNDMSKWKFGWGTYDVNSKEVTGDSLYLLAWEGTAKGTYTKFVKFWPVVQKANGDLVFKYANLDGTGETTDTLFQSAAAGKMYKYFKFIGTAKPNREPVSTDWDISFNRYFELSPNPMTGIPEMYAVMGIESKRGTRTSKVFGKPVNSITPDSNWLVGNYTKSFKNDLTGIGSGWKTFSGTWSLSDTMSYLIERIRPSDTSYWLMYMTGFSGSSSGKIKFSRMQLRNSLSVKDNFFGTVKVFPNPASKIFYLTLDMPKIKSCVVSVKSLDGKSIISQSLNAESSWNVYTISAEKIPAGIYLLQIQSGKRLFTQKLVIE